MILIKILLVFSLLIGLVLSACTGKLVPMRQITIDDLSIQGIVINPDADEDAILQQLGIPLERSEEDIYNPPRNDYLDNYIRYIYPGLEIHYYQCNLETNKWKKIVYIKVMSDSYLLDYGVQIGMKQDEIHQQHGNIYIEWESEGLLYNNYECVGSPICITFVFENDGLISMSWVLDI